MPRWHFNKYQPGLQTRNPIQSEFFTNEAVSEPGSALIREGIQNALDARVSTSESVLVRIYLSGDNHKALGFDEVEPFLEGLYPHLQAPKNGLEHAPNQIDLCPYLVFEDFSTTGLTGDPDEGWFSKASGNHFFNFIRAEGISEKGADSIGRWGVGKSVFNLASRASTFFCVTIRSDDNRRLMMGRTVLKHHTANKTDYFPDGFYGEKKNEESLLVLPIEDKDFIDKFSECFDLARKDESGLSVVVPWYDTENVNESAMIKMTIRDYFWAILNSKLEVIIKLSTSPELVLDSKSLLDELSKIDAKQTTEIKPLVSLAKWSQDHAADERIVLGQYPAERKPDWSKDLFPEGQIAQVRSKLLKGKPISMRVPVLVTNSHDQTTTESFFDIHMVKDDKCVDGRAVFIREGIVIPEVRHRKVRHYRCLVIVEDKPLATMLGDAENPAHTEWRRDTKGLKEKYKYAPSMLSFVADGPFNALKYLCYEDEEVDRRLLSDFFRAAKVEEDQEAEAEGEKPTDKQGEEAEGELDVDAGESSEDLRLRRVKDGFSITKSRNFAWKDKCMAIQVAYFTRKGNPFKAYNRADFGFDSESVELDLDGLGIVEAKDNVLKLMLLKSSFRLVARGFDSNRDLKVRATLEEVKHARKKIELHGTEAS